MKSWTQEIKDIEGFQAYIISAERQQYLELESGWNEFIAPMPYSRAWHNLSHTEQVGWLTRNFTEATQRAVELNGGYLDAASFSGYLDSMDDYKNWFDGLTFGAAFMVQRATTAYLNLALIERR